MTAMQESAGDAKLKSPRPRWHLIYLLLAVFDICTVALGLSMNHSLVARFNESVDQNRFWARQLQGYNDLGRLASAVDAPGNDVFDDHDVPLQSARIHTALERFEQRLNQIRADMSDIRNSRMPELAGDLEKIETANAEVVREAQLIFSYFRAGRPEMAGRPMATMDRTFDLLNQALSDERTRISEIQLAAVVKLSDDSLLSVINDILDFSKIEAGKLEMESIAFDLRESLGQTFKALGFRAHQKGLELVCDIDPRIPEQLLGDPGRLRQILVNLVGNAAKFTEHGEIFVNVVMEERTADGVRLRFMVHDTGVGIEADKQHVIFEAFSHADGSMARKYGSSRPGLPRCTRLVEMMNGHG